ncbi:U21-ctenitoxin-Pn1a-like [Chrysoperla carnea]|uniref:U21-ctenitoxin-Pn1a-like n=1 Tax=Chrysoperla carnea TaxID=189513 RepID=UPI001D078114|nr:U21-ctenitoxin-Pn1a-like [Chrysoperla carnea]
MAQLYEKRRSEWKFLCGAAILDENIVLTHAHCLGEQNNVKYYGVRAGKTKYIQSAERISDLINVERIEKHAGYDEAAIDYDVALIKLSWPIDSEAKTIKIGSNDWTCDECATKGFYRGTIVGWTWFSKDKPTSNDLKRSQLQLTSQTVCDYLWWSKYGRIKYGKGVNPKSNKRIFCAYKVKQQCKESEEDYNNNCVKTLCGSDFAGMFIKDNTLYGISTVSTAKCNTAGVPTFFTRLADKRIKKWVRDTMDALLKQPNTAERCVQWNPNSSRGNCEDSD